MEVPTMVDGLLLSVAWLVVGTVWVMHRTLRPEEEREAVLAVVLSVVLWPLAMLVVYLLLPVRRAWRRRRGGRRP